jgi:hypothetical protein
VSHFHWHRGMGEELQVDNLENYDFVVVYNGDVALSPKECAPAEFALAQNYPNPFNPTTELSFNISVPADASLIIYNVMGEEVATLFNGFAIAGEHNFIFDASQLSTGVYFYSLETKGLRHTRKMLLVK